MLILAFMAGCFLSGIFWQLPAVYFPMLCLRTVVTISIEPGLVCFITLGQLANKFIHDNLILPAAT